MTYPLVKCQKIRFSNFPAHVEQNGGNVHDFPQRLLGLPVISSPHPEGAIVCFRYDKLVIKLLGVQFGL